MRTEEKTRTEMLTVRVPAAVKEEIAKVASERFLKEADILREAVRDFLAANGRVVLPDGSVVKEGGA